jgi:DNA polymerase-3 subunit epsilon/ATP-dependent DNA helicase DinG
LARVYVSLDIETTGLDSERDEVLEIGAVRFKGDHIFDSFSTLINPGRPIPYKIQQLTGITPEDVADAPPITEILPRLSRFVGDSPIIGHNIGFDLGFMRRHQVLHKNLGVDTFELASILLPHASRYSLTALLEHLDIPLLPEDQAHRALDDARATQRLFRPVAWMDVSSRKLPEFRPKPNGPWLLSFEISAGSVVTILQPVLWGSSWWPRASLSRIRSRVGLR